MKNEEGPSEICLKTHRTISLVLYQNISLWTMLFWGSARVPQDCLRQLKFWITTSSCHVTMKGSWRLKHPGLAPHCFCWATCNHPAIQLIKKWLEINDWRRCLCSKWTRYWWVIDSWNFCWSRTTWSDQIHNISSLLRLIISDLCEEKSR